MSLVRSRGSREMVRISDSGHQAERRFMDWIRTEKVLLLVE